MSKSIYTVKDFMTARPQYIDAGSNVMTARTMMKEQGFRHLPVLEDGKVVGIISDRDIKLAVGGMVGESPETITMREVCRKDPYTVSPDAPLDEVAAEMEKHRYGSVLVVEHNKLLGIFTTVDACRALAVLAAKFNDTVSGA